MHKVSQIQKNNKSVKDNNHRIDGSINMMNVLSGDVTPYHWYTLALSLHHQKIITVWNSSTTINTEK